jgi:hypothetical protein
MVMTPQEISEDIAKRKMCEVKDLRTCDAFKKGDAELNAMLCISFAFEKLDSLPKERKDAAVERIFTWLQDRYQIKNKEDDYDRCKRCERVDFRGKDQSDEGSQGQEGQGSGGSQGKGGQYGPGFGGRESSPPEESRNNLKNIKINLNCKDDCEDYSKNNCEDCPVRDLYREPTPEDEDWIETFICSEHREHDDP